MSNETTALHTSPSDRLAAYFAAPYTGQQHSRRVYTDLEIQQISNLLKHHQTTWSRFPRTYIVLRTIGQLDLLNELIELGFTDHWFPVEASFLPQNLRPSVRAAIVKAQSLVITKSIEIEKGENGRHGHFGKGDPLPFEIKGKLGSGGFSQVDRISSIISYKEYALKRIRRRIVFGNESREAFKRFKAEVEIVKSLKHRHMVEFVGSYTDPTYLGLIMSPVADTDLSRYLKSISDNLSSGKSPLEDLSNLRSYFGCLVNALQYLHDQSIRHKDIKPQNILIASGNVLFTDFGLSRHFMDATGSTTSGVTYMTPRYSAPEVAAYEARNTSADIWSLGCVFLEMTSVLKGLTLDSMKEFFEKTGSHEPYINCNMEATQQWISKLAALGSTSDNEPLDWVKQMLVQNRHSRATAAQLFASIINGAKYNRPSTTFCGICCLASSESDSHDSLDEEFTETSRTDNSLPFSSKSSLAGFRQLAQPTPLSQVDFSLNRDGISVAPSAFSEDSRNPPESILRPSISVHQTSSDLKPSGVGASLDSPETKALPRLPTAQEMPEYRIDNVETTERRLNEESNESIASLHDEHYPGVRQSNTVPSRKEEQERDPQATQKEDRISIRTRSEYFNLTNLPLQGNHKQQTAEPEPSDKVEVPSRLESEDSRYDFIPGTSKAKNKYSRKKWRLFSKRSSLIPKPAKSTEFSTDGSLSMNQNLSSSVVDKSEQTKREPYDESGLPSPDPLHTLRGFISWSKGFSKGSAIKEGESEEVRDTSDEAIFGIPLKKSIEYANVAISVFNDSGEQYMYGHIPIIVAECGVFIKEKGVKVPGIFQDRGSQSRVRELRLAFDTPDRYGRGLDWTGYNVHDAVGILLYYLETLPEPVIPFNESTSFQQVPIGRIEHKSTIRMYQDLVRDLNPFHRQLLLYLLDFMALFISNHEINGLSTSLIASIFQRAVFSDRYDTMPAELSVNKTVLEFLIENHDQIQSGALQSTK